MKTSCSKSYKDTVRHYLNPLHIYCRLKQLGFDIKMKDLMWYDKNIFQPLLG